MDWYSESLEEVVAELGTDSEEGLTSEQVEEKKDEFGENRIEKGEEVSTWKLFLSQFQDFLIYLLFFAAFTSIAVGLLPGYSSEWVNASLILGIVFLSGLFGFFQDYKAEKSIQALKEMSTPEVNVLRDDVKREVDSTCLVPGDIIELEQGDSVPADARLIEAESLHLNESTLTGESENVSKEPGKVSSGTPVADRPNMVFKGTSVVQGRGKAVVVKTGMDTEVGSIAEQINEAEEGKTDFQKEVDSMGKKIGYGISAIIVAVALIEILFTSASPVTVLLLAVSLAVAAVPVSLPAVVTLTLALGSRKMLEKNALVRRLSVVESLGSADTIVTDKTGTLTEDRMTVKKLFFQGEKFDVTGQGLETQGSFTRNGEKVDTEYLRPLLRCGAVCNNSEKAAEEEDKEYFGDPTEVALKISAEKAGVSEDAERVREIPFSSPRKRMTVLTEEGKAFMKGAPETVLERCDRVLINGEEVKLTEEKREEILDRNKEFAGEALRVLGFARKEVEDVEAEVESIENGMVFLGLQGMIDPPREEVKEAVEDCRGAGIDVVMATGDRPETAEAIGKEIGFSTSKIVTGRELGDISDEELRSKVEDVDIFARVSPEDKVRIQKALKDNGRKVAMTGDGVNDAPALKSADVGISMGERGTDVAQQSSDMVLQDDNFATIRDAIEQGRGIFDNIRKFVNYLLSANSGEVMTVFFGILLGSILFPQLFQSQSKALILTPIMLIWFNFVTDGLPALALGLDPAPGDVMDREPRAKDEKVINKRLIASMIGIGVIMALTGLSLFFMTIEKVSGQLASSKTIMTAQTLLFTFFVMIELVRIQTIRHRYDQKLWSNKWLVAAIASSILLQLAVLYTPLNSLFKVIVPGVHEWFAIGAAVTVFTALTYAMIKFYNYVFKER
ncbi:MAG: cation-translocating P-type ATPase [Candidatus Nanohalobium sp.]